MPNLAGNFEASGQLGGQYDYSGTDTVSGAGNNIPPPGFTHPRYMVRTASGRYVPVSTAGFNAQTLYNKLIALPNPYVNGPPQTSFGGGSTQQQQQQQQQQDIVGATDNGGGGLPGQSSTSTDTGMPLWQKVAIGAGVVGVAALLLLRK